MKKLWKTLIHEDKREDQKLKEIFSLLDLYFYFS